jgi:DNA-binding CsgD family transcriptional regulator
VAPAGFEGHTAPMVAAPVHAPVSDRRREDLLDLCRDRSADGDFLEELDRRLRRLVPFDASLFVATDPTTTLPAPPVRLDSVDEECHTFWERELLVEDVLLYRDLARRQVPAGSMQAATEGHPGRSTRHRELNQPNGFDDELRVAFRGRSGCWGVASLWRQRGRPHFTDTEVTTMSQLASVIGRAFRRGVLEDRGTSEVSPTGPGLLVFSPTGSLESLNEDAAGWLTQLSREPDRRTRHGVLIPTEVYSVMSQARAVASGRSAAPARTRVRTLSGGWLALHASCLRDGDGQFGDTAVVIEPAHASEIAPMIVQAYELTEREQTVTRMIAQGLSTAEIAEALVLSLHTVRGYVKAVFEKIGVASRGELVARLFADHYYGPLHR